MWELDQFVSTTLFSKGKHYVVSARSWAHTPNAGLVLECSIEGLRPSDFLVEGWPRQPLVGKTCHTCIKRWFSLVRSKACPRDVWVFFCFIFLKSPNYSKICVQFSLHLNQCDNYYGWPLIKSSSWTSWSLHLRLLKQW